MCVFLLILGLTASYPSLGFVSLPKFFEGSSKDASLKQDGLKKNQARIITLTELRLKNLILVVLLIMQHG